MYLLSFFSGFSIAYNLCVTVQDFVCCQFSVSIFQEDCELNFKCATAPDTS